MNELRIRETRTSPAVAKAVQLSCPRCGHLCVCVFPYEGSSEQRMKIRHEVMNDHALICSAGFAEVAVVYPIEYPRA